MSLLDDWLVWATEVGAPVIIGGVIVFGVLIYAAWWALFADREKGRRRCPKCWYDMAYSPGMTCAECGYTARHEAQLHRRRRRKGVAAAAIVGCVLIAIVINERASKGGWAGMLPTQVILWLIPISGDGNSGVFLEFSNRAASNRVTQEQWVDFVDRCAAGDWRARPTSNAWVGKYGDFITSWRRSFVGDSAIEPMLIGIPPRVDGSTRATWPEGCPAQVSLSVRDWWPWGTECRITATPRINGEQRKDLAVTLYRSNSFQNGARFPINVGPLPSSDNQITLDLAIAQRREQNVVPGGKTSNDWQPVASMSVTVPAKRQGTLEGTLEPLDHPRADDMMMQVFSAGVTKWTGGRSPVRVRVGMPATFTPAFDDTAVGAVVEICKGDEVARRLNLWWIGGNSPPERGYGFEVDMERLDLLKEANGDDGAWTMRIHGDRALALRAGNATKYWAGKIELPLRVVEDSDEAPPRSWWKEGSDAVE